jgi:ubiquinone biosynthesis protein UbiJ
MTIKPLLINAFETALNKYLHLDEDQCNVIAVLLSLYPVGQIIVESGGLNLDHLEDFDRLEARVTRLNDTLKAKQA